MKTTKQQIKFTLTYNIPAIRNNNQRPSKQTLTNLSKEDLKDWIAWLNTKINATYTIK